METTRRDCFRKILENVEMLTHYELDNPLIINCIFVVAGWKDLNR